MKVEFATDDPIRIDDVRLFINEWNNNLDYIESQTSGSTGKPKVIQIQKKHMVVSARMTGDFLKLKSGDSALLCMSISTIAGKMMVVRAIILDLDLIVTAVTSSPLANIKRSIDFAAMVPLQVDGSLNDLSKIRTLIVGGGTISKQLWHMISESDVDAFQTFGMTETISHIAMRKISENHSDYKLLPGIQIKVEDDCLVVDALELGVENLRTNDHIQLTGINSFLWLGRRDFVINSGGVKIHPEVVEAKLDQIINLPFFVCGLLDDNLGEKLVLCIEGDLIVLKNEIESCLDKFHAPKEVYCFVDFERTENGKVNRLKTIDQILDAKKQIL